MRPGWVGRHPSRSRVRRLDVGLSTAMTNATQPKWSADRLARHRDDRHVQAPTDHRRDLAERHPLVGDRVDLVAGRRALEGEPVERGRVEPMHGGPAVETPRRRSAETPFCAGDADQDRDEAVRSPSPWTDGGRRTTETRTPRARDRRTRSPPMTRGKHARRGQIGPIVLGPELPGATRTAVPEVTTRGRSEPASA